MNRTRRFALITVLIAGLVGCSSDSSPTGPSAGGRLVYAALGASVTFGVGANPLSAGYAHELADRMAGLRDPVIDHILGIPGARIEDLLSPQLGLAVATEPDIVTVWTGSNDIIHGQSVEGFGAQLDELLRELADRTEAIVFVGNLADLTETPRFRSDPDPDVTQQRLDAFNARIAASATANGAVLVRLSDFPVMDSLFAIDGFHPNNDGHQRLADLFWDQIAPRL